MVNKFWSFYDNKVKKLKRKFENKLTNVNWKSFKTRPNTQATF